MLVDFQLSTYHHKSVFRTLPSIEVRGLCESCLVLLQIFDQGSEYAFNNIKYQKLLKTHEKKKTTTKKVITLRTVNLFHVYFDFLQNKRYCHFIRIAVKKKRNQVILLSKIFLSILETFKRLTQFSQCLANNLIL